MTQSREKAKIAFAFQNMLSRISIHAEVRTVYDSHTKTVWECLTMI